MSTIKHLNESNFAAETAGKTCLLDFWATWCGPCRMFAPILEQTAAELPDDILVGKIDVDKCPDLAANYKIRSVPSVVILKNGRITNSATGVQEKAKLLTMLRA